ncbi:hypothetical protein F4778DRAFT_786170 [Xylariomycetidae sp. FL2044]|nr:hypothetical protein F4778DRAFT_786170 [Xylariomycetidae sp. FL2044]
MTTPTSQPPPPPGPGVRIPETSSSSDLKDPGPIDTPTSPSSPNALARFEFEAGRGNEGSKILMVEWNPTPPASNSSTTTPATQEDRDGWEVSWDGKKTTFSLDDREDDVGNGNGTPLQRVYFLLPSGTAVPPAVTIAHKKTGRTLSTKCMPAIFAPGLGAARPDPGRRGVLHTIWAKKRVAQLQDEIHREMADNCEGVGAEMAMQERQWLIEHFGLARSADEQQTARKSKQLLPQVNTAASPRSPGAAPRSPIVGRLGEKLRGLKLLATSPTELSDASAQYHAHANNARHPFQSLSPDYSTDIAVPPSTTSRIPALAATTTTTTGGVASLDAAVMGTGNPNDNNNNNNNATSLAAPVVAQSKDTEDELFALPMSPRSPEMKTSPFSFLK